MYDLVKLEKKANELRKELLTLIYRAGSGHPGGSLSAIEIFTVLYYYKLKYRADDPKWEERDRVVVSKGHISPITYVTLADCGFFPKEELEGYRKFGKILQGHIHKDIPGVELSTGSLGQGLGVANGMALAARLKDVNYNVYCIMGDGEIQEGSIWEAAMTAGHYKISNICGIIDFNNVQENGLVSNIKSLEPLAKRFEDFGWKVIEVDGHSIEELIEAFDRFSENKKTPTMIIAHTVKGKGVSFMEGKAAWHGKAPNEEEYNKAIDELNGLG